MWSEKLSPGEKTMKQQDLSADNKTRQKSSLYIIWDRNERKRIFSNVRPTKTQISLRNRTVWSVFVVRLKKLHPSVWAQW